ncbi:MAG: IMP dehydrogenase [Kiritimatiellae bacterium]|nr:IMP dehydrogenase [Kiritimatiellia bacterium]MBP5226940.1 IMP dehydrogenase [Kiritimatiellia bacterium]
MKQFPFEGLTYDDVTLVTRYADFLPTDTSLATRLTSRIGLNIPFVSAAMDTVTEAGMATAMAMLGGIGVIHKNLTPEAQAQQVRRVKHHLNGLIARPVVFHASDSLDFIRDYREEHHLSFSGFPIVDEENRLVGLVTSGDMRFAKKSARRVDEVMTRKLITAAPDTTLEQAYTIMMENKIGKLPLVDSEGHLVSLYAFTDVKELIENAQPLYTRDSKYRLRVAAAVSGGDHARAEKLADEEVDVIVVDSAHGHTKGIMDMVTWITRHYPNIDVIGGNVATSEGALALAQAGAHAVKVGIGPGSICTTRVVCGVGIPQITAIHNARQALGDSIPVIADGGIRLSGDVPKALVAGADTVMLGSILAGTEESPGEKIIHEGRHYVVYRGMGSLAAMKEGKGSRQRYGLDNVKEDDLVPQGIEGIVPMTGPVKKIMTQFCGGLQASLGYCGARTIAELKQFGQFYRVSNAGVREAHPHDVKIIKEAPNYRS